MSQPPSGGPWLGQVQTPPPDSRRPTAAILLAIGAVVVVLLAVGALLLSTMGPAASPTPIAGTPPPASPTPGIEPTGTASPPPGVEPTGQPTPPAQATPPTEPPGSPAVGRTPPPDIAAQIDEVVGQVPPIRGLEPLRDVPYVQLSREEFERELEGILAAEVDQAELAIEGRLLQRLGMLPEDADLYELLLQLYGSQVAAYYRPDTGSFYIIERDEPFGGVDRMIVAHEYTHALQDQHYDLEGTRISDPSEGDAALAQLAAIEGDATLLMFRWALETLSIREQLELFAGLVPTPTDQEVLESMPPILRRQLEFPYNDGFIFATEVERSGGWTAIDETLARPPASTEQVLHPQKYFDGEAPIRVQPADLLPELGDGWQHAYEQTMGELNIQTWLAEGERPPMVVPGLPTEPTSWQRAAAGWGGDRLTMYENADGRWLIDWHTTWDSEDEAAEFEAYVIDLAGSVRGHLLVDPDPQSAAVRIWLADDVATMDLVQPPR